MKKTYKPMAYRKTEDDLSQKAYALLNQMFKLVCSSGLKVGEVRLVCVLLRGRIEKIISESTMGDEE